MSKPKILAVDDEEFNLDILCEYLSNAGFEVISADDGDVALQKMEEHNDICVIVLDRMMRRMNGMEVVDTLKKDDRFKHIPIIMQTAAAQTNQIVEGIESGVYYYLAKPYHRDLLVSIVKAAYAESLTVQKMKIEDKNSNNISILLKRGSFNCRTLLEAQYLGEFLGHCYPNPEKATSSLITLLTNSVYANVDVVYGDKTELLTPQKANDEVECLLSREEYKNKKASLCIEVNQDEIISTLKDQGPGFDCLKYNETPQTSDTPASQNLRQAQSYFTTFQYLGKGNEITFTKSLKDN